MMNSQVEEIKSRINIVDLVGEYVRLTKSGTNWKGLCPFHHEKSPSFMVNEEKQIFHCFGCAKGGDVLAFVMEIESLGFREALKLLAEKTGVQLEQHNAKADYNKNKSIEILELATKFYETQLWKGMGKDKVLGYLYDRGINNESIKQFRLGYAPPGWDNIIKFLTGRGFEIANIEKAGLIIRKEGERNRYYDRFRDRIMFPIADPMGKILGYSARVTPGQDESQAKYINSPETGIYHKSKALYGINLAKNEIKQKNFTLLVEGNLDVVAAHQAGLKNTVAVSGTALTAEQIDILKRYGESIKMLFDMDNAGEQASERSADLCFQKGISVDIVRLSEGKDAADAVKSNPQMLMDAVANSTPAMEYFFRKALNKHSKDNAEGKKLIAVEVLKRAANLSSEIEKSHWIKNIAQELEVEEKVIVGVLNAVAHNPNVRREYVNEETAIIEEKDEFKKRSLVIRDKIAGIVMSDPKVWSNTLEIFQQKEELQKDLMLAYIFAKGQLCNFSFDELMLKTDDERMRQMLQKLYFDGKYYFDSARNFIEYSNDEKGQLAVQYINEFLRELQKEKLSGIIKEIKIAEQKGDRERLTILMGEFTKLSQELK
jgi:DNA primase